ncbi:hypothetical protein FRC10_011941 [Ceratobasidium sp. 414]|nr:hypothetical protein FRC10_011941 [Ceratobasidium sp. 414]
MPRYKRTKHSRTSSRPSSNKSFDLLAAVESSPEPTTTQLGTERGHALFDTATQNTQATLESKRRKFRTWRGAYWDDTRKAFHEKSDKIVRGKARRAGESLYPGLTDEPLDGPLSNSRMRPSTPNPGDVVNPLAGGSHGPSTTASTGGGARTAAAAGGQRGTAGNTGAGGGAGSTLGLGQACLASRSPSPIPGTPGADPEVTEHRHFVDGIDLTGTESGYHNYVESLDPTGLAAEFCRFAGPKAPTLSSQEISARLKQYVTHHSAPVAPPERQVEVNRLSQNSFGIGHKNTARVGDSRPPKRPSPHRTLETPKRQRVAADKGEEHAGTETETETETENERTDTETEPELSSPRYQPIFPTYSPSPLPPEHVPSVTNALGLLGLPSGRPGAASLGTTQASIQDPVTPSQPVHNRQPSGARPPPSQATTKPRPADKQPPHPTSTNSSRTSTNNNPIPTQKKAHQSLQGRGIMGAISGSSVELLGFIQNSGELACALRELYRRQGVAAASGMALKDVAPMRSRSVQLEEDLVPDNEKERAAQAARAAGELPVGRKPKPASRDLHGYERQLLSPAKLHLFAYALKKGAIQTRPMFFEWSDKSWLKIWRQQLPNLPPEVASTTVKQILVNNMATGRGRFKDPVRPLVLHTFKLLKPALTDEDVNHNLKTFLLIHPNTFHCTRFTPPYGHYENDLVTEAIATTMFYSPTAVGVVYREFFNPMPLTTVAFVLSIIQFCIEEWETGKFRPHDLSMTDLLNKYVAHLRGLKAASKVAKNRMARLQQHWFDFGLEYSGATAADQDIYQPTTQSHDVRPDTPEPESEEEPDAENGQCGDNEPNPETDEEGRYTTQAKGKDRAQH